MMDANCIYGSEGSGLPLLWVGSFKEVLEYPDRWEHMVDDVVMCARLWPEEEAAWCKDRLHVFAFSDDIQPPSEKELVTIDRAALHVASRLAAKDRVYVACREGKNRSGLVAALALMRLDRRTGAEALQDVQSLRPGALYNWHFQELLRARTRQV